jgi:protein SCO1/2
MLLRDAVTGLTRRLLLGGLLLAPAAFVRGPLARRPLPSRRSPRRPFGPASFPDVEVITQDGQRVRFYEDLIKGKTVILNFMYAECEGSCPRATANLVHVQRAFAGRVGRDLFLVSLTLKPSHDTPEVLKAYAEAHGVRPGWAFVTGSPADLELLRRRLGFVDPDPKKDADKRSHIGVARFGNEPLQRWAACPALGNPEQLVRSIRWLLDSLGPIKA